MPGLLADAPQFHHPGEIEAKKRNVETTEIRFPTDTQLIIGIRLEVIAWILDVYA